jgi:hypothetical protein
MKSLPGLASYCDPPDLCLLSSWDYRSEPPAPGSKFILLLGLAHPHCYMADVLNGAGEFQQQRPVVSIWLILIKSTNTREIFVNVLYQYFLSHQTLSFLKQDCFIPHSTIEHRIDPLS